MEAIGAVASIIGIVTAGAKLSIALFEFGNSIGSAGAEVRAIGTEISLFCAVLKQLERTLSKARNRRYSISAIEVTQQILDQCRKIFQEIEGLIGGLQRTKDEFSEPSISLKGRVKWTLVKRSQMRMHRATLESCKITLHIMLTTLEFAQKVSSRRESSAETDFEDEQDEMVTQSLVIAQQDAINRLEKLEMEDEKLHRAEEDMIPNLEGSAHERFAGHKRYGSIGYGSLATNSPECPAEFPMSPSSGTLSPKGLPQQKRRSVWLSNLLAGNVLDDESRRLSSDSANSKIHQLPELLRKWTDQGDHWNEMHPIQHAEEKQSLSLEVQSPPRLNFGDAWQESLPQSIEAIFQPSPWAVSPYSRPNKVRTFPKTDPLSAAQALPRERRRKAPPPPLILKDELNVTPPPTPPKLPMPSPAPMDIKIGSRSIPLNSPTWTSQRAVTQSLRHRRYASEPTAVPDNDPEHETVHLKDLRIGMKDTCEKVIASFMKKHNLPRPNMGQTYVLYILVDNIGRSVSNNELPLVLYKSFLKTGKTPTFTLRKQMHQPIPGAPSLGLSVGPSTPKMSLPHRGYNPKELNSFFWNNGHKEDSTSAQLLEAYLQKFQVPGAASDFELGIIIDGREIELLGDKSPLRTFGKLSQRGEFPSFFIRRRGMI